MADPAPNAPSSDSQRLSDTILLGLSAMNFAHLFVVAVLQDGLLPGYSLQRTVEVDTPVETANITNTDREDELHHAQAIGEAALHLYSILTDVATQRGTNDALATATEPVDIENNRILEIEIPYHLRENEDDGVWYAVTRGRKNGIFNNSADAAASTHAFSNNNHKKFETKEEAEEYYKVWMQVKAIQDRYSTRQRELAELRQLQVQQDVILSIDNEGTTIAEQTPTEAVQSASGVSGEAGRLMTDAEMMG